jgi:DNA-directed RNA polymerase specialized sigma24 family protein
VSHNAALVRWLEREARGLLQYESAEDLAQGVHLRALEHGDGFEFLGDEKFVGWLFTLARRYVADRHDYWSAVRRGSGHVLRFTLAGTGGLQLGGIAGRVFTGPTTFAERRELHIMATRALATLPERDRDLVRWMSEGIELEEQGRRLGLGYAAVQRAGLRATERFKKAFRVVSASGASEDR